jgi:hypothetical protein
MVCFATAELESPRQEEEDGLMRDLYEELSGRNPQKFEVGTSVSYKNYDGTWMGGKIVNFDEQRGYTIEWDHGEVYVLPASDGEVDKIVEDAITQNSEPIDDDILGYFPSEMVEPKDSSALTTKESMILLFSLVGILMVTGYMHHKKLGALSSAKISEDTIWRSNGKPGTRLSLEMDDTMNLHKDPYIS